MMRVWMRLGWCGGGQAVGERQKRPFQFSFNNSLRVEFRGARVTSDGGLILVHELDERLGLSELMERHLSDSRRGKNIRLPLADLPRQSVYSRLAGYEDVNDAERLSQDPTFQLIGSRKFWERGAALSSRLQSFETEVLTQADNLAGLAALNRELIAKAEAIDCPQRVVPDMDSTEIPVYGQQERSAYNGHFESTCYHPLLLFNREGDCLATKLRPGNVHSAAGGEELPLPEIGKREKCPRNGLENGIFGLCVPARRETGPSRRRWKDRGPKPAGNRAKAGRLVYAWSLSQSSKRKSRITTRNRGARSCRRSAA
jgi:Transposase DDE domain group 1